MIPADSVDAVDGEPHGVSEVEALRPTPFHRMATNIQYDAKTC